MSREIQVLLTDAGRSTSRRPKQSNDCVVRAFAAAFYRDYDEMYDELAKLGRKSGRAMPDRLYRPWLEQRTRRVSFQAVKGERRLTLEQFALGFTGSWLVKMAKHMVLVRDGIIFDQVRPRMDACVYVAYEVSR